MRRLWLSYIAFSPATAPFVSYGGQITQKKFAGSVSSDISNSLYRSPYVLMGLSLLSVGSTQPLSFETVLDNSFLCEVKASRLVDEFGMVYIAVGVAPSKVCGRCGNSIIANENDCVTKCPDGTFTYTYKDGGVACRVCGDGLVLSEGKCVPGVIETKSVTTTKVTSNPSTTSSSSTTSNINAATSTKDCPEHSFFNGIECLCEVGYAFI